MAGATAGWLPGCCPANALAASDGGRAAGKDHRRFTLIRSHVAVIMAGEMATERFARMDKRPGAGCGSCRKTGRAVRDPLAFAFWRRWRKASRNTTCAAQLSEGSHARVAGHRSLHPQGIPEMNKRLAGGGGLTNVIGNPLETTIFLSHLIFDGTLDKFPGLLRGSRRRLSAILHRPFRLWLCEISGRLQRSQEKGIRKLSDSVTVDVMIGTTRGCSHPRPEQRR